MAIGVGVFALYQVVAEHYGIYAGLGTVAGLLIVAASALLLAATTKADHSPICELSGNLHLRRYRQLWKQRARLHPALHSWTRLFRRLLNLRAICSSLWHLRSRNTLNFPPSKIRFLTNSSGGMKGSAQGTADDAVRRAATLIRHGSRISFSP